MLLKIGDCEVRIVQYLFVTPYYKSDETWAAVTNPDDIACMDAAVNDTWRVCQPTTRNRRSRRWRRLWRKGLMRRSLATVEPIRRTKTRTMLIRREAVTP